MWGNKDGDMLFIHENKGDREYICNISTSRITNYEELPNSFQIKKIYFKATQHGSGWGQIAFITRLNFNGSPGISCIHIEI